MNPTKKEWVPIIFNMLKKKQKALKKKDYEFNNGLVEKLVYQIVHFELRN